MALITRLMQLDSIDIRERILEVDALMRMQLYRQFSTHKPRIAGSVLIYTIALSINSLRNICETMTEDVIIDEISEQRQLQRQKL